MMTASTHEALLYAPLLGNENFDEEEAQQAQGSSATGDKKDCDMLLDVDDDGILRYECIIFPFLLFIQFGLAFLRHGNEVGTTRLWKEHVTLSILLLTATIWLYRGACADSQLDRSMIFVFLPEILVNMILVLALFDMVTMAYATVLLGGLLLAILGFVATVHFMCMPDNKGQQEDEDNQDDDGEEEINAKYSKQVDLLIV